MIRKTQRSRGFTQLELLTVMAIIAQLLAVVGPVAIHVKERSGVTACSATLKSIGTALEMSSVDHGGHYPSTISSLVPEYLQVMPTCPTAGWDTYSAGYAVAVNPDAYTVMCAGSAHVGFVAGPGYPQYTSGRGLINP